MFRTFATATLLMLSTAPAYAASYVKADFSAGAFGGTANVKDPLLNPYSPGQTFTGSFVYDADLIPTTFPPNFQNVAFSSLADIASIPAGDAFTFNFGSIVFTLADDPNALIQYNKGKFNGFVFNSVFNFEGTNYLFSMNGGSIAVHAESDPFGTSYLNGYVNIGNANLTNVTPYELPVNSAVPEPATWAMMLMGFGLVGGAMRYRRRTEVKVRYA